MTDHVDFSRPEGILLELQDFRISELQDLNSCNPAILQFHPAPYVPLHLGERLARNDATPSRKSALE